MFQPTREQVEAQRQRYPVGCRVELVQMEDVQAPPIGTTGEVLYVDDVGSVHIRWSNGSGLAAAYGVDVIKRI